MSSIIRRGASTMIALSPGAGVMITRSSLAGGAERRLYESLPYDLRGATAGW